jgi:uncharacterized glyoxalase superfamily protein PhnB
VDGNETMTLKGIALSASLTVNDVEKSLAWYRDVFGFEVTEKFEREGRLMAVSLQAGGARVLLSQDDFSHGRDREKGAGFSLMITTAENIDELAGGIKSRGGKLEVEPFDTRWGQRAFRLSDPDGFRFTVSSERTR